MTFGLTRLILTQRRYVVYPPEGPKPPQSKRELDEYLKKRDREKKRGG